MNLQLIDYFWSGAIDGPPLWEGLNPDALAYLRTNFSWKYHDFSKGVLVYSMGTELDRLYLLVSGSLSAEIVDPEGRVLKIETLEQGAILAGPVLFSSDPHLPVQLTAETDCCITSLEKQEALRLFSNNPRILSNFLKEAGDKVVFLSEKIRLLRFATIREKAAGYFLEISRRAASAAEPPVDHTEYVRVQLRYSLESLADLFGVTRPALSRCLGEMVDEGLLARYAKGIYGVNRKELRKIMHR
ncbi:Crp/Fnr family transcriptional regulator [Spirochaeta dissipatitropha]